MKLLTVEQVAGMLQMNEEVIRRYLRDNKIKGFKVGRSWRVKEKDLNKFIEERS
ncbi:MAG: helix-turn-helix domain-containing protein [Candidatus Woesearchaeota archaeon]